MQLIKWYNIVLSNFNFNKKCMCQIKKMNFKIISMFAMSDNGLVWYYRVALFKLSAWQNIQYKYSTKIFWFIKQKKTLYRQRKHRPTLKLGQCVPSIPRHQFRPDINNKMRNGLSEILDNPSSWKLDFLSVVRTRHLSARSLSYFGCTMKGKDEGFLLVSLLKT